MPGRAKAVKSGGELEQRVAEMASALGLQVRKKVRVGRRLWGSERLIDVVVTDPETRKTLGIECKFQRVRGTAEEKLPATLKDIEAWPIPGILVFAGPGFSENMKAFLYSTGRAVAYEDLEEWLRLFFGIPSA